MTVPNPTERDADVSPGLDPQTREVVLTWPFPPAMLDRLSQEHGWTVDLTERALTEYRRFVVLALTSPTPVTPSRTVDEVWHTHLTFTRDYWEGLTPRLPRPLHHDPGSGDPGDPQRYAAQYAATLALYERTFGKTAPADLWPAASHAPVSTPTRPSPTRRGRRPITLLLRAGLAAMAGLAALVLLRLPLTAAAVLGGVVFAVSGLLPASGDAARWRQDAALTGAGGIVWSWNSGAEACDRSGSDGGCSDSDSSGGSSCGSSCGGGGCSS